MASAQNRRDRPHARIYSDWVELPSWQGLSNVAKVLLVEMLTRYRPKTNGRLAWPVSKVRDVVGVSKSTASRALTELEKWGWITCEKVSRFGGAARPSLYALTCYDNELTGEPASHAYRTILSQ
jgi:hypothetical protein